jgi:hypothetical protein
MKNCSVQSLSSRRRPWLRRAAGLALPAIALSWSSSAAAQGWLADRRYTEGPGIRTGDLELHPGIGGEIGYDSNWFIRSNATGPNANGQPIVNSTPILPPTDAGVIRITPSLYLSTLGQQRLEGGEGGRVEPRFVTFHGGASATGMIFIGKEMENQHNVAISSDARVDFNAGRPIGAGLFATYGRVIQPQVVGRPDLSFNRDNITAGAEVVGMPGGGTFDVRGSYQLTAQLFEQSEGVPYSSLTHQVGIRDRWRFRPRTALFSETTLSWVDYPNADRSVLYLNNSTPVSTRFGLTGLLNDRFGVLVAAGYSGTFFENPNAPSSTQYDGFSGQAQGTFYLGQGAGADEPGQGTLLLSTVSLGVSRDYQISLLGNFYTANRLYGKLEYWFAGRTVIRLTGYGEMMQYPQVFINNGAGAAPTPATPGDFTNWKVGGDLFAEYRFSQTFGLNTTISYVQEFSDTQLPAGSLPGQPAVLGVYDLNYSRFQAFLGARYFY